MSHICVIYAYICSRSEANWELKTFKSQLEVWERCWLSHVWTDQSEHAVLGRRGLKETVAKKEHFRHRRKMLKNGKTCFFSIKVCRSILVITQRTIMYMKLSICLLWITLLVDITDAKALFMHVSGTLALSPFSYVRIIYIFVYISVFLFILLDFRRQLT